MVRSILKYYVQDESDEDFIDDKSVIGEQTALHLAAKEDHLDCVKALIEAGADTYKHNEEGLTPWKEYKKKGKKDLTTKQQEILKLLKESRKYNAK